MRLLAGSLLIVHWGHPRTKAAAPGWSATLCDWPNRYSTHPVAGQAICLKGTSLSPICCKTRQPTGRQKRAKKNYSVASEGKKSLMCWFLSPNHSLKK